MSLDADTELKELLTRICALLIEREVPFSFGRLPEGKWSIAVHDKAGARAMEAALIEIGVPREGGAQA